MNQFFGRKTILFAVFISFLIPSCTTKESQPESTEEDFFSNEISNPGTVHEGDTVLWNVALTDSLHPLDSVIFSMDGKVVDVSDTLPYPIRLQTEGLTLGQHLLTAEVVSQGKSNQKTTAFTLMARSAPQAFVAKAVKSYPHDPKLYTQGLEFVGNQLLMSGGQYGQSSIRLVDWKTGKVAIERKLEASVFGEGCTVLGGKVYQLSWKELTCFIYDAKTLNPIGSFKYPRAIEGWGITNNGKELIMSDGTNKLYFIDPKNPSTVSRVIEVFSHEKMVDQLNELEWVNGSIYANVYMTDDLVGIDPQTGAVKSFIYAGGLLSASEAENAEVLNGIAYNPATKTLFLTGKYWPKLFEVELAKGK